MKKCLLLGLAIMLLVSVIGVTGCKGAPEKGAPEKENSFLEMLKVVPDTPGTRFSVYINDYARIREIYDIPLPSSDADDEAIEEYIETLEGDPSAGQRLGEVSFVSGMGPPMYAFYSPIRRQNIGFGPQDVDQDISAGPPPITFEAIKGRFDLAAVEDAISRCDESVMPDIERYEGIVIYDWGPDISITRPLMPPAFDNLGRGEAIAVQEDYVFRVLTIEAVKAMIDASQGELTSLADNPDFSLMAEALSEMGAYSAFLTDQVLDLDFLERVAELDESVTAEEIIAEAGQLLSPYRTYATGIGKDEEGVLMTIVLVYGSSEEASSDVVVLEQRIEKGTSIWTGRPWLDLIDSYEVWADGRTLRATLRGNIVRSWLEIVYVRDTLLLQGE